MGWDELVAHVLIVNSWERRVTCVFHPDASGVIESEKFGNIRTARGEPGYCVTVSEKVKDADGNELPFVQQRGERVKL